MDADASFRASMSGTFLLRHENRSRAHVKPPQAAARSKTVWNSMPSAASSALRLQSAGEHAIRLAVEGQGHDGINARSSIRPK